MRESVRALTGIQAVISTCNSWIAEKYEQPAGHHQNSRARHGDDSSVRPRQAEDQKGSTVAFFETDDGRMEIRVIEADVIAALDELGDALEAKGVTMNEWLAVSRKSRKRAFDKLYPGL